jgi:hypothetical protein
MTTMQKEKKEGDLTGKHRCRFVDSCRIPFLLSFYFAFFFHVEAVVL